MVVDQINLNALGLGVLVSLSLLFYIIQEMKVFFDNMECLGVESLLEESADAYLIRMDDMCFRRAYIEETRDLLKAILEGEEVDYESFYMSISLEMIANSRNGIVCVIG